MKYNTGMKLVANLHSLTFSMFSKSYFENLRKTSAKDFCSSVLKTPARKIKIIKKKEKYF